jgi:ribosome maturation factor RimP
MATIEELTALIAPVVETAGFDLVRVSLIGGPSLTLQVMLEDPATGQMKVDDCARVSRRISAVLDEVDPIDSEYMLEVSSPGIDRPLTRLKDFDRWAGHIAKVELADGLMLHGSTRKRFQGPLLGTSGEDIRIDAEGIGEIALPFSAIQAAKLLLTDRLIAETAAVLTPDGADEIEEEPSEDPSDLRN